MKCERCKGTGTIHVPTSHEIAKQLLELPDLPLVVSCEDYDLGTVDSIRHAGSVIVVDFGEDRE